MNVAAWLGTHLYSAALVLLIALPALVTVGGSDYRSTAVLPPLTPVAVTLDTTTEDALAEGMDVVPVSFHDAPYDLWSGLRDQYPGAYLDDVPGIGTFYVPAGSTIDVPGGLYLATLDGWAQCRDEWSAQECGATGPVVLLDIPVRTADSVYRDDPAALAADRALAGLGIMTEGATAPQVRTVAHSEPLATNYPRRSPAGARVLPQSHWLDNSPVYRDGYVWLVDDTAHTTSWRKLAEDGSLVPLSFYDHVTTTGATQARCDYLGKQRVPDATYGHRCA